AKNRRAPARGGKGNGAGSAAVPGRINPMTELTTRFDHANRTTEHTPAGGGEESPRSRTRWKRQRRWERGRPRPHQPDDRAYHRFRSRKSDDRTCTGCGRRGIAALLHAVEKATALGARPSPAASMRRPNTDWLGANKNSRARADTTLAAVRVRPLGGRLRPMPGANLHADSGQIAS
ncbi:MAG: hypothetical protein GX456_10750, partial [Verrucomicrobia bacterium]|nr:hypothetical protein [Verrucomicrobiota bacterium]